jgi:hypothetical protein
VVDRRFNRRKYNAVKTIETFSARLRDQVDLETLATELLAVTDKTMHTTTVTSRGPLSGPPALDLGDLTSPKLHGMQGVGAMIGRAGRPADSVPILGGPERRMCSASPLGCWSVVPTRRMSVGDFVRWPKP